jgi:type I restriction enzyme S subunit
LLQLGEKHIQANTIGMGIPHVNGNVLRDLTMLLPTAEEQTKIAEFLDYKTNLIDAIIDKKKHLITLLKEKRQAVINEAVTKGLNPNATMKNSGVDSLGDIPEDWNLVPLRYLYNKIGSGVTPKGGGDVYVDEGITFIRSQNVHFDGLRLDDVVKIENDTHLKMNNSNVEFNDVLLNITGASIGRCCVVNIHDEMNVNQHVCIIRVNKKINPNYLNIVLQSNVGQIQIKLLTTGGNREGLTHEAVKNLTIPLPDIETQLHFLNNIKEKLDSYKLINESILASIKNLQTYRQSLISEAVTGKIDVRDWQPPKNR